MSLPSLGRTQLQPVSPLVKLGPGGTAGQGNAAVALSICLSVGQLLSSPLPLVDLSLQGGKQALSA